MVEQLWNYSGILIVALFVILAIMALYIRDSRRISQQQERISNFQNHMITSMAQMIESRDISTGLHVKRTSEYVGILARVAREEGYHKGLLTEEYIEALEQCAPLHDVGKIMVTDLVLNKPGRLTPEEIQIMRSHTEHGREVVEHILGDYADPRYYEMACDIATYHHEHWDGSGYPEGLKGEEIPVSARIMAVADVFDALVTKRVYKEPLEPEKACEVIESCAGTHFDPELIRVFQKAKPKLLAVLGRDEIRKSRLVVENIRE